jgi:hypothetical protein
MILIVLGPLSGAEPPLKESWPTAVDSDMQPGWALRGDDALPDEVERYATDLIKGWSGPACVADAVGIRPHPGAVFWGLWRQ